MTAEGTVGAPTCFIWPLCFCLISQAQLCRVNIIPLDVCAETAFLRTIKIAVGSERLIFSVVKKHKANLCSQVATYYVANQSSAPSFSQSSLLRGCPAARLIGSKSVRVNDIL
jgi:hypothetical protein